MIYCKLCENFMQKGRFPMHKCNEGQRHNAYGTHKTPTNFAMELNDRTSLAALKYIGAKHELEQWSKARRNADYDKQRIKVKRLRRITLSLMDGKSMKQAKKQAF